MHFAPIALFLAAGSFAAPTAFFNDGADFSKVLAELSRDIDRIKLKTSPATTTCDISKITLPSFASGLPAPDGLKPMYVALGRGTQVCHPIRMRQQTLLLIASLELYLCRFYGSVDPDTDRCGRKPLQCHLPCSQLARSAGILTKC